MQRVGARHGTHRTSREALAEGLASIAASAASLEAGVPRESVTSTKAAWLLLLPASSLRAPPERLSSSRAAEVAADALLQFPVAWFTGAVAATGVFVHTAPAPAAVSFASTMTTQASGAPRAHAKPMRSRTPTAGCRTTAVPTPEMRRVAGRGGAAHCEGAGGRGGGEAVSEALAASVPVTEPAREAAGEAACEADTEGVPLGEGVAVAVAAPDALGVPVPVGAARDDDAATDGVEDALAVRL